MNSFTTVFIILTNDGVTAIFQDYYRACGPSSSVVFFILLSIIGQKILLSLFIAILLENFDEGVLKQKMHEYEQQQQERNKTAGGLIELTLLDRIIAVFTRISQSLDDCLNKREPPDDDSDDDTKVDADIDKLESAI